MTTAYIQRDPRWSRDQLGTSSETIGTAGCLITCVAAMLTIEPGELNDWLNLHHGYVNGNRFVWSAVQPLGARAEEYVACATTPAPMQKFADALAAGRVVLAMVDWEPGGKVDTHWVRLLGIAPGETAIMDPWQPTPELALTTLEEHYCRRDWDAARAILRATIYERGTG